MCAPSLAIYPSLFGLHYTVILQVALKKARPKEALFTFYVFALSSASETSIPDVYKKAGRRSP